MFEKYMYPIRNKTKVTNKYQHSTIVGQTAVQRSAVDELSIRDNDFAGTQAAGRYHTMPLIHRQFWKCFSCRSAHSVTAIKHVAHKCPLLSITCGKPTSFFSRSYLISPMRQ
ncbi:hypothetical protein J6590_053705 [Homalodisca vitripennis]|nr:hypothetical protein J6590_053705 [Homalodisca vitripennis]